MPNSRTLLNRQALRPETVAKIEAMGELASQVADRWAGGWPRRTRKLELEGRLFQAISDQLEQERKARELESQQPWVGGIEARQLLALSDEPPA